MKRNQFMWRFMDNYLLKINPVVKAKMSANLVIPY